MKLIYLLVISLFVTACSNTSVSEPIEKEMDKILKEELEEVIEIDKIKEKISEMTLEEKIGQLLIVGFEGYDFSEDLRYKIEDLKLGGLIFFTRNIESAGQVKKLIEKIKESEELPLFISIDEEGGLVSRLPKDMIKMPKAMDIGKKSDELVYLVGNTIGYNLRGLGFNVDFAPVLDINSNPKNPVIGERAFGNDLERVVEKSTVFMKGLQDEGILAVGKHFPGHGDTDVDSHSKLPVVKKTREEINNLELVPFVNAIEKGIDGIMVSHVMYEEIDNIYPSSLSEKVIRGLLREDLGYGSLVFSDDITMSAVTNDYSVEEGSFMFLKAGGDVLLVCHGEDNPKKVIERIKLALDNGEISLEEIEEKVYRILKSKEQLRYEPLDIEDINKKSKETIEAIKER